LIHSRLVLRSYAWLAKFDVVDFVEAGLSPNAIAEAVEAACEPVATLIADAGPTPLASPAMPTAPYPINALGGVLSDAARAIAAKVQCADAMAAQSVLAVASLAAQALADMRLPYGQTRPLSLFCVTIASSGDRKTSADSEAMAPVRMREKQLREVFEPRAKDHAVALAAWRGQRQQIERKKADVETRRFELQALGPEPEAPIKPVLTLGESTAEGLARHMPVLPGALGIFSAEGGQFLSGHGFLPDAKLRTAASFASLWDGQGLRRLRAGDGLIDLHGRRLACHLMIQPEAAAGVLGDPVLRDQGFLSRLLLAAPESLAGGRMWQEPRAGTEPALRRYIARMLALLEMPAPASNTAGNELTPRALELCPDARKAWIGFHDAVETAMRPDGRLAMLRDVAGKAAEQAARIAGVLETIEDASALSISAEQAGNIGRRYGARVSTRKRRNLSKSTSGVTVPRSGTLMRLSNCIPARVQQPTSAEISESHFRTVRFVISDLWYVAPFLPGQIPAWRQTAATFS